MELSKSFKSLGIEVVKADNASDRLTMFLRVPMEPPNAQRWRITLQKILATAKPGVWSVDISKSFFLSEQKTVKYLWRFIVTGDHAAAAEAISSAIRGSLSAPVEGEITSFPLIGRIDYKPNPAAGKTKGVYDPRTASSIVSTAARGGV